MVATVQLGTHCHIIIHASFQPRIWTTTNRRVSVPCHMKVHGGTVVAISLISMVDTTGIATECTHKVLCGLAGEALVIH